jgi:hypothetical protein
MSSLRLKQLVDEILERIPPPHDEGVIEEVFARIEADPVWRKTYADCTYLLGKPATAAWTGFWVAHAEQRLGEEREAAARTTLIESYSKLGAKAPKRNKKLKEPDAVRMMHEHYQAHRATLPASVRDQREVIVTLIMDGLPPEVAFEKALEKPAFAW